MSTNNAIKDFWEYNPSSNSWTQKSDFAGVSRAYASGFSIGNKGYVCLGEDYTGHYPNDVWEYDPLTDYWTEVNDFPGNPRKLAVVFVINGHAYLGTGLDSSNPYISLNDFWEFTP